MSAIRGRPEGQARLRAERLGRIIPSRTVRSRPRDQWQSYHDAEDVRAQGLQPEMAGEVVPNLHPLGGYTYIDTEGASAGLAFSDVTPKHIYKLSAVYESKVVPWMGVALAAASAESATPRPGGS